jgi:arginase family enzyme
MNSARYQRWLLDRGGTVISARRVHREGMESCVGEALRIAADGTDLVYLTVDIDCLAYPWAVGTSASTAEGLDAWDLMEAVWACGQHPKVATSRT